jgi:hypothetical protein
MAIRADQFALRDFGEDDSFAAVTLQDEGAYLGGLDAPGKWSHAMADGGNTFAQSVHGLLRFKSRYQARSSCCRLLFC